MNKTSRIPGFYKLPPEERLDKVKEFADLSEKEVEVVKKSGTLGIEDADRMIENVVGTFELPLGVAVNFLINGKDYLIPMATEESSVTAAASNAAKIARTTGGFETESTPPQMIGQIQVTDLKNLKEAKKAIESNREKILELANQQDPVLAKLGGGAEDLEIRKIKTRSEEMLIVHLIIDTQDAM
ncbi:3-hydroxy-3-methylglutaryl-CoA reductase, partial [candidate division MSBL1 archaeon SCGC-AAA259E19]